MTSFSGGRPCHHRNPPLAERPPLVTSRPKSNHRPTAAPASPDRFRGVALGAAVALLAARPLAPTEAVTAATGDGLPFVMLTLLLICLWWLSAWARPRAACFGWVDLAWAALICWQAMSTWAARSSGAARPAINVFWEWAGMWLGFVLLRQVLADTREARAVAVVMIAVAVLLSFDGLFQYAYSMPAVRTEYQRDPDRALREARIDAPPGSPERILFENRLNSTEPIATFSLTNSLAGVLTVWLVCLIGVGWLVVARGPTRDSLPGGRANVLYGLPTAAAVVALAALAVCLLLTKSRSGYIGTMVGMAAVVGGWALTRGRRRADDVASTTPASHRWLVATALGGLAMLVAITIGAGALDRQVLTEATKSLGYRWQFWQGAWGIIRAHPWLGCGLGNFQDHYTAYKLPEASEVVAEPHNLLFEVWATCGTPALLALVAVFVAALVDIYRASKCGVTSPRGESADREPTEMAGVYAVIAGGMAALPLAYFVSLTATVPMPAPLVPLGLVVVLLAALAAQRWIEDGPMPVWLPLAAGLALVVNLLAAGGIGYSSVAGSLWTLLAIATWLADCKPRTLSRRIAVVLLAISGLLSFVCYQTAYRPVLSCRGDLVIAENEPAVAIRALRAAAAADPLADEPWRRLADALFARWQKRPSQQALDAWEAAEREILARRPAASVVWQHAGDRYHKVFQATSDRKYLNRSIEAFAEATRLYPNHALVHARLAQALSDAGQNVDAAHQAAEALRLHEITPHRDQKLPDELVRRMRELEATLP